MKPIRQQQQLSHQHSLDSEASGVQEKVLREDERETHTHTDRPRVCQGPTLVPDVDEWTKLDIVYREAYREGEWMIFWRPSVFLFLKKNSPKQKFILLLVTSVGAGISSFGWTSTRTGTLSLNNPKISSKLFLNVVNLFRIIFRRNLDENLGFSIYNV